jgi:DNA-directed RNA polymerase subunit RPC12/RpoP
VRKLTEPQAHRGRVAIIEGRFPEGMQARCAWCGKVALVEEGEMRDTSRHASGPARVFRCADCSSKEESAA